MTPLTLTLLTFTASAIANEVIAVMKYMKATDETARTVFLRNFMESPKYLAIGFDEHVGQDVSHVDQSPSSRLWQVDGQISKELERKCLCMKMQILGSFLRWWPVL